MNDARNQTMTNATVTGTVIANGSNVMHVKYPGEPNPIRFYLSGISQHPVSRCKFTDADSSIVHAGVQVRVQGVRNAAGRDREPRHGHAVTRCRPISDVESGALTGAAFVGPALSVVEMAGENVRDGFGDALAGRNVEKFVRAVGVGMRAQHAGDDELRLRKFLAQHAHEGNTAALAHIGGLMAEGGLRRPADRLFEPGRKLRRVPALD